MLDLATLVIDALEVGVTGYVIARLIKPRPLLRDPNEKVCTGYVVRRERDEHGRFRPKGETIIKSDCGALRSASCLDGRCTFHCSQTCRCTSLDFRGDAP